MTMIQKLAGLLWLIGCLGYGKCALAIDNGVYIIKSKHSGKVVETAGASSSDGANVSQWQENGHDTQRWLITDQGAGQYAAINLSSGKALEVSGFATEDGANVVQYEFNGGNGQLWQINELDNGYVSFINVNSQKALDLYSFDTTDGANISQWSYLGHDAQQWQLIKQADVHSAPWDPSTTHGDTHHWPLSGNLVTHDPTIGYEQGTYWVFQTGPGIYGKYSNDGLDWSGAAAIFPNGLNWWKTYVPEHDGLDVWAPELKHYNGRAWLYYAISTFGSRTSAIGLTSASSVANGDWQDEGLVLRTTDSDNYNAIDPDLVIAADGAPWLAFGSWNSGIKLMRINPMTMKPFGDMYSLASRSGGIEAPTIVYRKGYYYLFVSVGKCCDGANSTYRIAYGRSNDIRGPYLDKNGVDMRNGGGTIMDAGNSQWVGPGGQDILNTDVMVRHAYDANDNGTPKLLISTLNWDSNGWPTY